MRETAFDARFHAEVMSSGAAVITDTLAMDGILDRLHNGVPTLGWEGDPRLALAYNKADRRWELWRREYDDVYRFVGRSPVDQAFPHDIINRLVSMDGQRGYELVKDIERSRKLQEDLEAYRSHETFRPVAERMAWALHRDLD